MPITKLMKQIKDAVLANHGGFEDADDAEIERLWASLAVETQNRYLGKTEPKKNDRDGSEPNG